MILQNHKELEKLKKLFSPYTQRVYFVGGCVRDYYQKIPTKDIDIEVFDIDIETFENLMKTVDAKGFGKSFFVYKYKNFDISLPRVESKVAYGHTGFEVAVTNDIVLASRRRDFTMNSIMINIFTNEVVDNNGGLKDLKRGVVKHIDSKTFIEDSLRVLRAVQFCARFNLSVDEETLKLCKSIDLEDLSKTRIFLEFEKFFNGEFLAQGAKYIYSLGIYEKIFKMEFSEDENQKLLKLLKGCEVASEYKFLYFLREVRGVKIEVFLETLQAPKRFYTFFKTQPMVSEVKEIKDLLKLALKIPLENWLGLKESGYYDIAKKIDLLDKKFLPKVTAQDLLNEGLSGKELGEELEIRKFTEVEDYYGREMGIIN